MHQIVYARRAENQLQSLFIQIASAASPEIAARYIDAIMRQCESLSTFPTRGSLRNDIRPGIRIFGFRRRVSIAFGVAEGVVTIHGIFYGGQDIEESFEV
ncbi:MAG: type II toxin-antitoxin system RelE/ParE family toxin [Terracidiphilus sp.]